MRKTGIFALVMIWSPLAFCLGFTEYMILPASGVQSVRLQRFQSSTHFDLQNSSTKLGGSQVEASGWVLSYGCSICDTCSFGTFITYGTDQFTSNTNTKVEGRAQGFSNPHFLTLKKFTSGEFEIVTGGDLAISLEKAKIDSNGFATNRMTGGHSLEGTVAAFYPVTEELSAGLRLGYEYFTDQARELPTGDSTISGGDGLETSALFRYRRADSFFGARYMLVRYNSRRFDNPTGPSSVDGYVLQRTVLTANYNFKKDLAGGVELALDKSNRAPSAALEKTDFNTSILLISLRARW